MLKRFIASCIILCFSCTSMTIPQAKAAQETLNLPVAGTMVNLSPAYMPVMIKGVKVHPDNPLLFDFILDTGKSGLKIDSPEFKSESQKLIKYFLASLTIKEDDLWVNLSPYEKDRMIPQELGKTELGRDMLAQDYILKQLTASLIYPEKELGKKFWDNVYTKARQMYGVTNIPVNTFNKVWIVADKAKVLERNNAAYVVGSHLKVMLEEDYLSMSKHANVGVTEGGASPASAGFAEHAGETRGQDPNINRLGSQIIRQIILPELDKEVNQGQNFAPLRQMFYSMILASWYKLAIKDALLNQVYSNKAKTSGVLSDDPAAKEKIYQQYLKAYKKGVFNYIKEDIDAGSRQSVPRKYFSGGIAPDLGILSALQRSTQPSEDDAMMAVGEMARVTVQIARKATQKVGAVASAAGRKLRIAYDLLLLKSLEEARSREAMREAFDANVLARRRWDPFYQTPKYLDIQNHEAQVSDELASLRNSSSDAAMTSERVEEILDHINKLNDDLDYYTKHLAENDVRRAIIINTEISWILKAIKGLAHGDFKVLNPHGEILKARNTAEAILEAEKRPHWLLGGKLKEFVETVDQLSNFVMGASAKRIKEAISRVTRELEPWWDSDILIFYNGNLIYTAPKSKFLATDAIAAFEKVTGSHGIDHRYGYEETQGMVSIYDWVMAPDAAMGSRTIVNGGGRDFELVDTRTQVVVSVNGADPLNFVAKKNPGGFGIRVSIGGSRDYEIFDRLTLWAVWSNRSGGLEQLGWKIMTIDPHYPSVKFEVTKHAGVWKMALMNLTGDYATVDAAMTAEKSFPGYVPAAAPKNKPLVDSIEFGVFVVPQDEKGNSLEAFHRFLFRGGDLDEIAGRLHFRELDKPVDSKAVLIGAWVFTDMVKDIPEIDYELLGWEASSRPYHIGSIITEYLRVYANRPTDRELSVRREEAIRHLRDEEVSESDARSIIVWAEDAFNGHWHALDLNSLAARHPDAAMTSISPETELYIRALLNDIVSKPLNSGILLQRLEAKYPGGHVWVEEGIQGARENSLVIERTKTHSGVSREELNAFASDKNRMLFKVRLQEDDGNKASFFMVVQRGTAEDVAKKELQVALKTDDEIRPLRIHYSVQTLLALGVPTDYILGAITDRSIRQPREALAAEFVRGQSGISYITIRLVDGRTSKIHELGYDLRKIVEQYSPNLAPEEIVRLSAAAEGWHVKAEDVKDVTPPDRAMATDRGFGVRDKNGFVRQVNSVDSRGTMRDGHGNIITPQRDRNGSPIDGRGSSISRDDGRLSPGSGKSDRAALASPGGIDLNAKNMGLDVTKDGQGIEMKFDPAMVAEFQKGNFTGVEGIILKIVPIQSPLPILGLDASQP